MAQNVASIALVVLVVCTLTPAVYSLRKPRSASFDTDACYTCCTSCYNDCYFNSFINSEEEFQKQCTGPYTACETSCDEGIACSNTDCWW